MAGARLKSLCNSINPSLRTQSFRLYNPSINPLKHAAHNHLMPSYAYSNGSFIDSKWKLLGCTENTLNRCRGSDSSVDTRCYNSKSIYQPYSRSSTLWFRSGSPFVSLIPMSSSRSYSSSPSRKIENPQNSEVFASSGPNEVDISNSSLGGGDWVDKVKDAWQSAVDAVTYTGQKAKEVSDEVIPHAQQLLDSHPYLKDVVVPISCTLTATILAWVVMPRLLRKFHKYAMQSPVSILSGNPPGEQVPYEKSFWGALEDPVRYLVTFLAFSEIAMMVAPTTIASHIAEAWKGAIILSFIWFLHRWKTNVFARVLVSQRLSGMDRQRLLTVDKVSSIGLFVIGIMALAEACGVAVQSILTVGGIGGVATAFAAKDILGNVLSGLSMQFSQPFSLGDTIKAGSIEGQVVEMGFTTTLLLNPEKFPVLVPNSLFSSQVIVNKSRAQWRAVVNKIPLHINDLDKIPQISGDVKSMLRSNSKVFTDKEAPYCFLSRVESSFAELTLGYNLIHMRKDELYAAEQDIILQSVRIIKEHGARLGSSWQDTSIQ
ncbi:mechanosensitive ion channel protein 1 mitochondrial [Tripterygium wilfordii]|uniref:Mechanosensitive ion channel protein 1 mitochondrial n=1 Tax=Tripterygium wilfordii TaxID=458696 RepID=A0A7J7CGA0_TRIWF|nr:mechanosensitive ion channel protein 1, mitochondrial isoform X1 [Tripterygium wilfordii]XP_038681390.1 mechanosensitive ion channel protein 1, mitochondrial isoform X2 [Tripterygium wilfordii]XP_038681391.1 mechanosensitive ion channel protein 1, mitochondrial isoform X2 [Tripterygium wilfordii]KAF5733071.1 mechanosensitive ion channel protein 1 mitochondrial [Tripterygium wilfordii]